MNELTGSKRLLTLTIVVIIITAFAIPIVSSMTHARAASPGSTNIAVLQNPPPTPALSPSPSPSAIPSAWFQLAPGNPPSPRTSLDRVLAYDQANNRLIIFGGNGTQGYGPFFNETWVLVGADGTSPDPQWIQLNTVNPPAPRDGVSGAYDAAHNNFIIFGGCVNNSCAQIDNDVYVLSNANGLGGTPTWTQLSTTGGPPHPRSEASAIYDQTSNELIIFGGYFVNSNGNYSYYNDTWVLSNANGLGRSTPTWTQLNTVGGPPSPRASQSAIYDTTNHRLIIFGGFTSANTWVNDTWVLSNASGLGGRTPTWTQLSPNGTLPPARDNHGAVYDASANNMIIFGGSSSGLFNDVWVLSHANGLGGIPPSWKQIMPVSTSPIPRNWPVVNYRSSTHRLIVWGGTDSNGNNLNDTWILMNIS